jgi:pimeloyl-ACP methyl ester carboxylesterase
VWSRARWGAGSHPGFRAAQPAEAARIAKLIADTPAAGYIGCAGAIRALDITARIGAIRAPTLVIAGADDPGTPPAMSEVIAATIPGATARNHSVCITSILHRAAGNLQPAGRAFLKG